MISPTMGTHVMPLRTGRTRQFMMLGLGAGALLAGIVSVDVARRSPGFTFASEPGLAGIVGLAAGWVPGAVGVEAIRRGRLRFGALVASIGIAWFASTWANPGTDMALVFTIGLTLGWMTPSLVGHLVLNTRSAGNPQAPDRLLVVVGYLIFVILLGLVPALTFDPAAVACLGCPDNLIGAVSAPELGDLAGRAGRVSGTVWIVVVIGTVVWRVARQSPASRRQQAPFLAASFLFLGLAALEMSRSIATVLPPTDSTDHLLRFGQAFALVGLGTAVAFDWLRARRTRTRVARVVADLGHAQPSGGLRDILVTALQDPDLRIGYPVGSGFVDVDGGHVSATPAPGRRVTPVVRDGSVVAILDHRPEVLERPDQIDEVVATARLGLEYERLQAVARAQLEELQAARRRIVAHGDAVRRQLERDLHDGAQQRIVALTVALQMVTRGHGDDELLESARADLRRALDELRRVAHGIYPSVLADEGLAAAIEGLAEASPIPVRVERMPEDRFRPEIETAAYQLVADLVERATGPIRIDAWRSVDRLVVEVTHSGLSDDTIEDGSDRILAIDGTLLVVPSGIGATVRAELPCAS